jgi:hypothetical protein
VRRAARRRIGESVSYLLDLSEARPDVTYNYCMQRTAGRLTEVVSKAALAGRR